MNNFMFFIQQHSLLILLCCLVCILPIYNNRELREPAISEKFVAAINYLFGFGIIGFVCLMANVVKGGRISPFLQYHIFQSFFLIMLYWLLTVFVNLISGILYFIPLIKNIVPFVIALFVTPIIHIFGLSLSIISICLILFIIYLVFTSIRGQYSYVPWVSDIIKQNVRR